MEEIDRQVENCGVSMRFMSARKENISPVTWQQAESFMMGDGLYLHGPSGTGKTHLVSALVRQYVTENPEAEVFDQAMGNHRGFYVPSYPVVCNITDVLTRIRASFRDSGEREDQIIADYSGTKNIIFDDLGVEKASEWALQTLYAIIDKRYRDMKQTSFTSNYDLDQLSQRLSDRIASRIAGMCKIIKLEGKDRRLQG
jgi:DNA replication protein DnaC